MNPERDTILGDWRRNVAAVPAGGDCRGQHQRRCRGIRQRSGTLPLVTHDRFSKLVPDVAGLPRRHRVETRQPTLNESLHQEPLALVEPGKTPVVKLRRFREIAPKTLAPLPAARHGVVFNAAPAVETRAVSLARVVRDQHPALCLEGRRQQRRVIIVAQFVTDAVETVKQLLGPRAEHVGRVKIDNRVRRQPGEQLRQHRQRIADDGPHACSVAKLGDCGRDHARVAINQDGTFRPKLFPKDPARSKERFDVNRVWRHLADDALPNACLSL